jgi:hypothetical protein
VVCCGATDDKDTLLLNEKGTSLYVHKKIGEEIRSISGHITVLEEIRLKYEDRDLLCVISAAILDNSCCGVGGCSFIEVPGYILSDHKEKSQDGSIVSKVEPVRKREDKEQISAVLKKLYPYSQIYFG